MKADDSISAVKANKLMTSSKKTIHDLESAIDDIAESSGKILGDKTAKAVSEGQWNKGLLGIISLISLLLAIGLGIYFPRSINRAIKKASAGLKEIAIKVSSASAQVSSSSQQLAEGASAQAASIEETLLFFRGDVFHDQAKCGQCPAGCQPFL